MKLISKKNLKRLISADPHQRLYTTANYYRPILKILYRRRIKMALALLSDKKYEHLLDIGFGGGVITPELAGHCRLLEGIDVHSQIGLVRSILKDESVNNANLRQADRPDYPDDSFDAVWCLSVLEFIADPELMIKEIKRVATAEADIVLGFPLENRLTDFFYRLIGFKNKSAHKNRAEELMALIEKYFQIEKIRYLPAWPAPCRLFVVIKTKKLRG